MSIICDLLLAYRQAVIIRDDMEVAFSSAMTPFHIKIDTVQVYLFYYILIIQQ